MSKFSKSETIVVCEVVYLIARFPKHQQRPDNREVGERLQTTPTQSVQVEPGRRDIQQAHVRVVAILPVYLYHPGNYKRTAPVGKSECAILHK